MRASTLGFLNSNFRTTLRTSAWAVLFGFLISGCVGVRSISLNQDPAFRQTQTLAQAATAAGKWAGSEVEAELLRTDDRYREVVKREFNIIVPQNEMKFGWVNKDRSRYDFTDADFIVDFAQRNKMKVRGTTLAWHRNYPRWLKDGHFSKEELKAILITHIKTVVSHFRDRFPRRVFAWDVVNEAIRGDGILRDESLWAKIGTAPRDYISLAFRAAKQADPDMEAFYNDFGAEEINAKSDAIFALLRSLKESGLPIDGIGFQMHLDYRQPTDFASVRKNMERFAKLGLHIQITEFDYLLPEKPTPAQITEQTQAYRNAAALYASFPDCKAFLSWGFTDAHSWIPDFYPGFGNALYFDREYRPKLAYFALISGFNPDN